MIFSVYSLRIRSTHPLPGVQPLVALDRALDTFQPDIDLVFAGAKPIAHEWTGLAWHAVHRQCGANWEHTISTALAGDGVAMRVDVQAAEDKATVFYAPRAAQICLYWQSHMGGEERFWADLSAWLLGSLLAYATTLRGAPTLHGSVIAIDGRAVALLGDAGAGKSTLAAALVGRGHSLLSDDHLVLTTSNGYPHALPGIPRLRLWPTSLDFLALEPQHLPRVTSVDEKRFVDAPAADEGASLPLAAIYLLGRRSPTQDAVTSEPLPAPAAVRELLAMRFVRCWLSARHAAQELAALAALGERTPVYQLHRPDSLAAVPLTAQCIEEACIQNAAQFAVSPPSPISTRDGDNRRPQW